jgi:hypothetical protein
MDFDFSKIWISGAGFLVGAIGGGYIWAQRAAAIANKAAEQAGEDALLEAARTVGTSSLGAALQGAFVGGMIGLVIMIAYFYFTDPDRGMTIRKMDTGDDRW